MDCIPSTGFLRDYVAYAQAQTDAPQMFHIVAGLGLLSALADKIGLAAGYHILRPNIWILILASTSFLRKSTALGIAKNLLWAVNPQLFYPNEFSRESIIGCIKDRHGVFLWSEFGGVLAAMSRQYMSGCKDMLAEMYDCDPPYMRELVNSKIVIDDPYFAIMAASSLRWFADRVDESDKQGGFLTRFLIAVAMEKENDYPMQPPADMQKRNKLIAELKQLAVLKGQMTLTEAAQKLYTIWRRQMETELTTLQSQGENVADIYLRLTSNCLKVAMLIELSKGQVGAIGVETMNESIAIMKSIFEKGFTVLSEHLTHSKVRRKLDKIMTLMKQHKRIKRSTLLFYMQMTAWEFDQYIHTLKETGKIIEEQGEKPVRGRTATYYELTDDTINYDEEISMEKV